MDQKLEDKANDLDATDPAKAKAIRETALFYARQRTQDLLTQMAVTVQGYLALDLVKKNNVELVKGVDRASTTTVAALRTAVTVAQALTNQKLVLEQITQLNTTTANIIDSTGKLLKSQTAQIHEQAAASTIPVEVLQRAFQNIYDTMDAIDVFKLKALDSMKTTVTTLSSEVEKSKGYIARAEGQAQAALRRAVGGHVQAGGGVEPYVFDRRVIAKAREMLERTSMQYRVGPGRRARENDIGKRVTRAAVADLAIIGVAVTIGLVVGPIGIMGFFLMLVAMLIATAVLLATPATAAPTYEKLRQTDLKALPAQTGRWLDAQRPALPAPAISVVDQIGLKLDALTPQLATLDEDEPAAAEIRKLVGEQLPEFIKGYERVPSGAARGRAQRQDARPATGRRAEGDRRPDRRDGRATRAGRP